MMVQTMIQSIASMTGERAAPLASDRRQPVAGERTDRQQTGQPQAKENATSADVTQLSPVGLAASRSVSAADGSPAAQDNQQFSLTAEEIKQLQQLKQRDREVKAHEQAHLSVAGSYARGGASFSYQKGPDGNRYAIGGEVPIDVSEEASAEATILKMQVIRRAALAPADPSPADRQIAANALAKEIEAKQQMATENQAELNKILDSASEAATQQEGSGEATSRAGGIAGSTRSMMLSAYQRISALS